MLKGLRGFFRGREKPTETEQQRQERSERERQQGRDLERTRILYYCNGFGIAVELDPDGFPSYPTRDALVKRLEQEGRVDQITIHEVRVGVDEHYWTPEEWADCYSRVIPPLGMDPEIVIDRVKKLFSVHPGLVPMITDLQERRPDLLSPHVRSTLSEFFRRYNHPFVPRKVIERVWLT